MNEMQGPPLHRHFADFIMGLADSPSRELALAARLVSQQVAGGNICLDLLDFAEQRFALDNDEHLVCPEYERWCERLLGSGVVGHPGQWKPLILDRSLLYLQRYWHYEKEVADFIRTRSEARTDTVDRNLLEQGLDRLFPPSASSEADWQREAAQKALLHRFCVITGGPGTGKTTTVARMLALFLEQKGDGGAILLAAPTGKAATRLQEAICRAKEKLDCSVRIREEIPEKAVTVHRLLGRSRRGCLYHRDNPLPASLVVVDEASMVDLSLMAALMAALPSSCSLVLLGDRDQLASVQPGAVLGDICQGLSDGPLSESLAALKKSYRFDSRSGIGAVSQAVKCGDGEAALDLLMDESVTDVRWFDYDKDVHLFKAEILARISMHQKKIVTAKTPEKALQRMSEFAVLAALRHGPSGAESINSMAEEALAGSGSGFYHGKPFLISRNHYGLQLYNGDTGLMLQDAEADNELRACLQTAAGVRRILPPGLPAHETAFAVTVHKSQGSEFEHVVLVLPQDLSPVLCRELIYTGLTRAAKSVAVWGNREVFVEAVRKQTSRKSGLVRDLTDER